MLKYLLTGVYTPCSLVKTSCSLVDTLCSYVNTPFSWFYTPSIKIHIINIKHNSHDDSVNAGTFILKPRTKTSLHPVYTASYSLVGTGYNSRLVYTPSYRTEIRTTTLLEPEFKLSGFGFQIVLEYLTKSSTETLNIYGMCKNQYKEFLEYFDNNKCINVRFLFGKPIIPEINYNFWTDSLPGIYLQGY